MLAVNPKDPSNVVVGAKDYTPEGSDCVWAGTSVTKDGGATWTNGFVGGPKAQRDPHVAFYDCVTDPVLEFGPDGMLYYLVEAYGAGDEALAGLPATPLGSGFGSNMWLAVSQDGGLTWGFRGLMSLGAGGNVLLHDKSDLAVSPVSGTIVAAWDAFNPASAQLVWVRSTDRGATFSPPRTLIGTDRATDTGAMVDLEWDAQGALHAVFFDWNTGEVLYARSDDDGASFGAPQSVAAATPWTGANAPNANFRIFDSPMLAVDASEGLRAGWLYLVWADDSLLAGDHDVWFTRSEDGGASWARPVQVGSWTGSDQFHPNVAVAGDGSVHVLEYDRHHDPANRLLDATWLVSEDGGQRWRSGRLSASSFDGDLGIHQSGVPFMGDYLAIGAGSDKVYMAWADTRGGRSDVAFAAVALG
jgi:hypothetical protein